MKTAYKYRPSISVKKTEKYVQTVKRLEKLSRPDKFQLFVATSGRNFIN